MYVEWKLVLVHIKIVLVTAKDRCPVCAKCTSGMEIALGTPEWYTKVMYVKWKLVSVCFEIVLVLAQDRCTVAPNVPRARKSFWAHPIILLGNIGQEEACFGSF